MLRTDPKGLQDLWGLPAVLSPCRCQSHGSERHTDGRAGTSSVRRHPVPLGPPRSLERRVQVSELAHLRMEVSIGLHLRREHVLRLTEHDSGEGGHPPHTPPAGPCSIAPCARPPGIQRPQGPMLQHCLHPAAPRSIAPCARHPGTNGHKGLYYSTTPAPGPPVA